MEDKVLCPHCGEANVYGSNICGGCMKDIRKLANPNRDEFEETAKTRNPHMNIGLWRRIARWWKARNRRAR